MARSGLRFDKVALAFVARLRDALCERVPRGKTLVVTCTAPIRKDSATAAALASVLETLLAASPPRVNFEKTINGNRVRARLIARGARDAVVGFVHDPNVDVEALLRGSEPAG